MDLKRRLNGLTGSEAIAVAHLLFRYLSHRLDERAFRQAFIAEAPSTDRERAYDVALATIHDIEAKEHSIVQSFSKPLLHSYLDKVAELSKGLRLDPLDPALREKAQSELELIRAM